MWECWNMCIRDVLRRSLRVCERVVHRVRVRFISFALAVAHSLRTHRSRTHRLPMFSLSILSCILFVPSRACLTTSSHVGV